MPNSLAASPQPPRLIRIIKNNLTFIGIMISSALHAQPIDTSLIAALQALTTHDSASYIYLPITRITPGQLRYSQLNVKEKVNTALAKHAIVSQTHDGTCTFAYDNGQSILSTALPIIIAPFGPVLVDGHHDTLASIALGATTIPVYVLENLSHLSPDEFWLTAIQKGLVYPYSATNEYRIPQSFADLQDDPNRFFAALVARKCVKNKDGSTIAIASPKTPLADYPIWVKFGNEIPFIEFKISDALKSADIVYDNAWGANVSQEFVEKARAALIAHPITGLKVIPVRTLITDNSPASKTICQR